MAGCREIKQALGVYVLGAIDPAERALVDEHLSSCQECREELASLAGLPAMLRKVPIVEAERLAAAEQDPELAGVPSAELLTSLIARTANVRRMHRWRTVAAAAAVAIVALGGGAFVANALQPSGAPAQSGHAHVAWSQTSGSGPVAGAAPHGALPASVLGHTDGSERHRRAAGQRLPAPGHRRHRREVNGRQLEGVAGDLVVPRLDLARRE